MRGGHRDRDLSGARVGGLRSQFFIRNSRIMTLLHFLDHFLELFLELFFDVLPQLLFPLLRALKTDKCCTPSTTILLHMFLQNLKEPACVLILSVLLFFPLLNLLPILLLHLYLLLGIAATPLASSPHMFETKNEVRMKMRQGCQDKTPKDCTSNDVCLHRGGGEKRRSSPHPQPGPSHPLSCFSPGNSLLL